MAKGFTSAQVTVPAATAISVAALLAAEGYTGSMVGAFLELDSQSATVFWGHDSTVDATNGRPLAVFSRSAPPMVDPSRYWLYSAAGGEIGVTFDPI